MSRPEMIQQLRAWYYREPFTPWTLVLKQGGRVRVAARHWFSMAPSGDFVVVFDEQGHDYKIRTEEIEAIEPAQAA